MATSTSTSTWTITHTATHLADVILGSIVDILSTLRIDPTRLFADWDNDQRAISAWIAERSLDRVALECHQPSGIVSPILEFPVTYTAGGAADQQFTADRASLARYLAKLAGVPVGTQFKLFVTFEGFHSSQPGWGSGIRASTVGMRSHNFGTLATGPHAGAGMRYLAK